MRSHRRTTTRRLGAIAAAGLALATAPAAVAAATDLRAASVKSPRTALTVLGGGVATVAVVNGSGVAAKRMVVSLYLSKDRKRDARDAVIGGVNLRGPRGRAKRTLRLALAIPGKLKPGSYYLIACVTAGKQKQTSSRNDCIATTTKVKVGAPTAAVIPTIAALEPLAVTTVIGPAGGSATAAGATGGSIVLTVPAKALSAPTSIRIVPVASVTPGPPGVTALVAAILEPEGLAVPGATIAFTIAPGFPTTGLAGLAFGGEDESIVRAPLIRGKGLRLDASILGGYGLGFSTPALPLRSRPCVATTVAAVNPCAAESLRKRVDAIAAAASPTTIDEIVALTTALTEFSEGTLGPAATATANGGGTMDDLSPIVVLQVSIERQAQILGIETGANPLRDLFDLMEKVGRNEIKRCSNRTQGPARTANQVYVLLHELAVSGASDATIERLGAKLDSDCLSKPYLLTYEMTTDERWATSNQPPSFNGGRAFITDLPVLYPKLGGSPVAATGPMSFTSPTCDAGNAVGFIACEVTSTAAELEARVVESKVENRDTIRCGRTVKVPSYKVVFQLQHPTESEQLLVTIQPLTGPPQHVPIPTAGTFDRALTLATTDELGRVTLPDNGGDELLIGTTLDFHGSMLRIDATGKATLKLK